MTTVLVRCPACRTRVWAPRRPEDPPATVEVSQACEECFGRGFAPVTFFDAAGHKIVELVEDAAQLVRGLAFFLHDPKAEEVLEQLFHANIPAGGTKRILLKKFRGPT